MKKIFVIAAIVLLPAYVFAQAPQKMSYQAVIRNSSNQLVTNQVVGMQISILKDSPAGTVVYSEIQAPSTNDNGLITIEIGGETGFDTIHWEDGTYYLKTETDPGGGTSYTITGTSQILSVPYALHAKTADAVYGTIEETDPLFHSSVAAYITSDDTASWNNKLDAEVDGSVTNEIQTISRDGLNVTLSNGGGTFALNSYSAGKGIDITDNVISAKAEHAIGDLYRGGVIFWLDSTGRHGLVAAISDQSGGLQWYNGTNMVTGATHDAVYAGKGNSEIIIKAQGAGSHAAHLCDDYSIITGGEYYGDWYLPSPHEFHLMYLQKDTINDTATANGGTGFQHLFYWSSNEYNSDYGVYMNLNFGTSGNDYKSATYAVHAISAF